MPVVAVIGMRGERLMALGEGSGFDHPAYVPARERIVTTAY